MKTGVLVVGSVAVVVAAGVLLVMYLNGGCIRYTRSNGDSAEFCAPPMKGDVTKRGKSGNKKGVMSAPSGPWG